MSKLINLSDEQRVAIISQVANFTGLGNAAIEKDWWVTQVLRAIFSLPYSDSLSFKGGTSLSKCWQIIERFSEDVDIAVNREYLGFSGNLSKTQISDKLRRASCSFVRERLQFDIKNQLLVAGISESDFSVDVNITPTTTTDPEIVDITYRSIFEGFSYIVRKVKVEVSGRSMSEPIEKIPINSLIDSTLPNTAFAEEPFEINAVSPKRTFLEKICLLHEEFAPTNKAVRTERMSRHLYDLSQMMNTSIAEEALADKVLFESVVTHRRQFIGLKDFDYNTLSPETIEIIPPIEVIDQWRTDYQEMRETMIYGDTPTFEELMKRIEKLNEIMSKTSIRRQSI